jgi:Zn finger protein HypA/HybF involved in hydrogenase expression
MPYFKCIECHHEWESADLASNCSWCKSKGYILEESTPLEKLIKYLLEEDKRGE